MNNLTDQQIFDTVAKHLLEQGTRSVTQEKHRQSVRCRYRGDGGLSCAVGCLIPDAAYTEEFEGFGIRTMIDDAPDGDARGLRTALDQSGIDKSSYWLLSDLQSVHDQPRYWIGFPAALIVKLTSVAATHNLSTIVFDKVTKC